MRSKSYAAVTATIFLVVAAAHALRAFIGFEFRVGTYNIPAHGYIGLAVAG